MEIRCNKFSFHVSDPNNAYQIYKMFSCNIKPPEFKTLIDAKLYVESESVINELFSISINRTDNKKFSISFNVNTTVTYKNIEELEYQLIKIAKLDPDIKISSIKISLTPKNKQLEPRLFPWYEFPTFILKCSTGKVFELSLPNAIDTLLSKQSFCSKGLLNDMFFLKMFIKPVLNHAISNTDITDDNFHKYYSKIEDSKYNRMLYKSSSAGKYSLFNFFRRPKFPVGIRRSGSNEDTYSILVKNSLGAVDYFQLVLYNTRELEEFAEFLTFLSNKTWTFELRPMDKGIKERIKHKFANSCLIM